MCFLLCGSCVEFVSHLVSTGVLCNMKDVSVVFVWFSNSLSSRKRALVVGDLAHA